MVQSARNRFTGIVTRVERDTLTAVVEIQAGPHRVSLSEGDTHAQVAVEEIDAVHVPHVIGPAR